MSDPEVPFLCPMHRDSIWRAAQTIVPTHQALPVLFLSSSNHEYIVPVLIDPDVGAQEALRSVAEGVSEIDGAGTLQSFAFVNEAWIAKRAVGEPLGVRPSQDPNREEALTFIYWSVAGDREWRLRRFTRQEAGFAWVDEEETPPPPTWTTALIGCVTDGWNNARQRRN